MQTLGLSSVLQLFDLNVKCAIDDITHIGMHNIVVKMAENQIKLTKYNSYKYNYQMVNNMVILQVVGELQFVSFEGKLSDIKFFCETFILNYVNNKVVVINYLLKCFTK